MFYFFNFINISRNIISLPIISKTRRNLIIFNLYSIPIRVLLYWYGHLKWSITNEPHLICIMRTYKLNICVNILYFIHTRVNRTILISLMDTTGVARATTRDSNIIFSTHRLSRGVLYVWKKKCCNTSYIIIRLYVYYIVTFLKGFSIETELH